MRSRSRLCLDLKNGKGTLVVPLATMRVEVKDCYLTELRVEKGKLTFVGPGGPSETDYVWAEITELCCHDNLLQSLPPLPSRLKKLCCSGNQLTSLPLLPEGLEEIDCHRNQLTSLPPLPEGVMWVYCRDNLLQSLPLLPKGLKELYCYGNRLTSLPSLPRGLEKLFCQSNLLRSLPPLPESLEELSCRSNLLGTLPPLPKGLLGLGCSDNPFSEGVDPGLVPPPLRDCVPKKAYDLYFEFTALHKERLDKVLLGVTGAPIKGSG